jgi:23S rRNA (adenine2503-C2)-methyltransferase
VANAYDVSREELAQLLTHAGQPGYRVGQVWDGLHGAPPRRPAEMTNLPAALRARLEEALPAALTPVVRSESSDGQTVKWLWALADGAQVETVLMRYADRVTVCVSSQAGCAMGCTFCATGQAGFRRHLTAGEIVEQVVAAQRETADRETGRQLSNVVFMGMGEPLANYDRWWSAVTRLHDDLGFSARHLTVSTVGVIPGIRRLSREALPINLAVSLHAADDAKRDRLVPLNRRYPLAALAEVCRQYVTAKGRRLSFEWALIDRINDTDHDAEQLATLAQPLAAHVNLIPLNPTPGYPVRGSSPAQVRHFRNRLRALGVNATVRRNRGVDIDAACGQLAAREQSQLAAREHSQPAAREHSQQGPRARQQRQPPVRGLALTPRR